jgi:hypothetical protein
MLPTTIWDRHNKPKKMSKLKLLPVSVFLIMMGCTPFMNLNGQNLEKHTWKNRILLVKTSDSTSEKYQEQVTEFRNSDDELIDRKFILYKIIGDDFELIDFSNSELNDSGKIVGKPVGMMLNDTENFEVILIGLDGGIKLQQTEVLKKDALFAIVDAMPMRRSELSRKKTKN